MLKLSNKFNILKLSPWPLIISFNIGDLLLSLILGIKWYIMLSLVFLLLSSLGWFEEIRYESVYEGCHTNRMNKILYLGFLLFLLSEVLIFGTLFGSFFYNSINPSIELFNKYPYYGINVINKFSLPLFNTALLYISGISCTIAINMLSKRNKSNSIFYLILTILISLLFLSIQYFEYNNSLFSIVDGIFSTNFYVLTGFHGIHVILGTILLIYSLYRVYFNFITFNLNTSIIISSLYWHFVDYVWILLYITVYIWAS